MALYRFLANDEGAPMNPEHCLVEREGMRAFKEKRKPVYTGE